jgi:hypothetical protein
MFLIKFDFDFIPLLSHTASRFVDCFTIFKGAYCVLYMKQRSIGQLAQSYRISSTFSNPYTERILTLQATRCFQGLFGMEANKGEFRLQVRDCLQFGLVFIPDLFHYIDNAEHHSSKRVIRILRCVYCKSKDLIGSQSYRFIWYFYVGNMSSLELRSRLKFHN